jgi:PAS domain-containing protein
MQPEIPAGPPPTPDQREDPVRRTRAGAATQSVPPAYEDEDGPTADERLDGGPLESEQVFRATFDRAAIGIAHVSPEGRWLRVNQRLCDLLGYDRAELAARTWREITHPADLPTGRAAAGACGRASWTRTSWTRASCARTARLPGPTSPSH